jgi:hypothetical protein
LPAFFRLIRLAKTVALIADILTIIFAVFIVGWQINIFLRQGAWPALPLAFFFNNLGRGDAVNALLLVPTIVPLLLAMAFLTAFYLWLTHIERQYSKN